MVPREVANTSIITIEIIHAVVYQFIISYVDYFKLLLRDALDSISIWKMFTRYPFFKPNKKNGKLKLFISCMQTILNV